MSVFTGGGPISEPIRAVYRQLRCNLPADADIMGKVEEIASRTSAHSTHSRPSGIPAISDGSKSSHLDRIRSQADTLRKAFNRLYFIECNLLKFDDDGLKAAEETFQKSRNMIDSEDSSLVYITLMVEEHLKTRRYFLCTTTLTQETIPIGLPISGLFCYFRLVTGSSNNYVCY